jgi:hypothetical protein
MLIVSNRPCFSWSIAAMGPLNSGRNRTVNHASEFLLNESRDMAIRPSKMKEREIILILSSILQVHRIEHRQYAQTVYTSNHSQGLRYLSALRHEAMRNRRDTHLKTFQTTCHNEMKHSHALRETITTATSQRTPTTTIYVRLTCIS